VDELGGALNTHAKRRIALGIAVRKSEGRIVIEKPKGLVEDNINP